LNHPIADTGDSESAHIVLPAKQIKRNSDIYITVMSNSHLVCKKGLYVAIISAKVETEDPESEIKPALALLGEI
jgi:Rab GDP dissociation inhibitor